MVSQAVLDRQGVVVQDKKPRSWRETIKMEVSKLEEKPVPEAEFTLDALGVPRGARVVDDITGMIYPYGGVGAAPLDLEKGVADAFLLQTPQSVPTTRQAPASAPYQPALPLPKFQSSRPSGQGMTATNPILGQMQSGGNPRWAVLVIAVGLAMGAGGLAMFLRRRSHAR